MITLLGEEGADLCASRAFVYLFCTREFLTFFSSSWCQGLAAASDCGNPWTFLLTFYRANHSDKRITWKYMDLPKYENSRVKR